MSTRRGAEKAARVNYGPNPRVLNARGELGPPQCSACPYVGWPDAETTPYVACKGDAARHVRPPIGGST